jgi:succinate dehydrogenase / fumarate reductase cytochrome b subunit
MQATLTNPWIFALYLAGLLLSVLHLANGLWSMGIVWGVTASARAQAISAWVFAGFGLLLAAIGIHGLVGFLP